MSTKSRKQLILNTRNKTQIYKKKITKSSQFNKTILKYIIKNITL